MSTDPTRERLAIVAEVNSASQARFIPAFASYHSPSTVSCRLTNAIRIFASAASVFSEISPVEATEFLGIWHGSDGECIIRKPSANELSHRRDEVSSFLPTSMTAP